MYPQGYMVADAQNMGVDTCVQGRHEWLLLVEDDTMLPFDAFMRFNAYMKEPEIPVISGLYFLKANPSEPLVYRGRGNSCYDNWKIGDKVWVDGVPTGCLLIHHSVLRLMWNESPTYKTGSGREVKRVFETPSNAFLDPETGGLCLQAGTSDLFWCDRVMREKVLERSGWKDIGKRKYPFLVDTNIMCKHIDLNTGVQYPLDDKKWRKKTAKALKSSTVKN